MLSEHHSSCVVSANPGVTTTSDLRPSFQILTWQVCEMALASPSWCLLTLACACSWLQGHSALAPENEVPLRPTTWLQEGKLTPVTLPKGRTRRYGRRTLKINVGNTIKPVIYLYCIYLFQFNRQPTKKGKKGHSQSNK